jgi:hypothetical protein
MISCLEIFINILDHYFQVEKRRSCGHSFPMMCHEDPEEKKCLKSCKKSLACGHFCKRKCHESCTPCTQLVDKVVPHCGHTVKVPCGREPVKEDCEKACERKLPGCKHPCTAKCAVDCASTKCCVSVGTAKASCGHDIENFCHEIQKGILASHLSQYN